MFLRFVAVHSTPKAMTTREVERESDHDPELDEVRQSIKSGDLENCPHKAYVAVHDELCSIGKCILRGSRIVVPQMLRPRLVMLADEGNLKIVCTKQNLRTKVWVPGMERDMEKFVKSCHGCQLVH